MKKYILAAIAALTTTTGSVSAQEEFFQCSGDGREANVMPVDAGASAAAVVRSGEMQEPSVAAGLSLEEESMSPPLDDGAVRSTAIIEMADEGYVSNLYGFDNNGSVTNEGVGISTDFMTLVHAAADYCASGAIDAELYRGVPNPGVSYRANPFILELQ